MTGLRADRIAGVVTAAVEGVFACVADLHDAALAALGAEAGARAGATDLERRARQLLAAPGQLAVGLGLVAAPRPDRDVRLLWWQADGGRIAALRPDLRPASLDFYDYPATEWFDVPRQTGQRHVVGPYVDVHGTGRYLLTLTAPLVGEGEFLGVIGADVPVNRFENHLLRGLDAGVAAVVVLNEEGRVVLSTSPRWMVGDLLATPPGTRGTAVDVPGLPWRLYLPSADQQALAL